MWSMKCPCGLQLPPHTLVWHMCYLLIFCMPVDTALCMLSTKSFGGGLSDALNLAKLHCVPKTAQVLTAWGQPTFPFVCECIEFLSMITK